MVWGKQIQLICSCIKYVKLYRILEDGGITEDDVLHKMSKLTFLVLHANVIFSVINMVL